MKKKLLTLVAAATMTVATVFSAAAVTTVPSDTPVTVGTDTTTAWWSAFSDYYALSGDFNITFDIDVTGSVTNWNNFITAITTAAERGDAAYSEYMICRADNYSWCVSAADNDGDGNPDPNITAENEDVTYTAPETFDTFAAAIADSNVDMTVVRSGNNFTLTWAIHGNNGTELTTATSFTTAAADDIYMFLGADASYFTINSVVDNNASGEVVTTTAAGTDDTAATTAADGTAATTSTASTTGDSTTPIVAFAGVAAVGAMFAVLASRKSKVTE